MGMWPVAPAARRLLAAQPPLLFFHLEYEWVYLLPLAVLSTYRLLNRQYPHQMKSKFLPADKCNKQHRLVDQNAECNMKGVAHSESYGESLLSLSGYCFGFVSIGSKTLYVYIHVTKPLSNCWSQGWSRRGSKVTLHEACIWGNAGSIQHWTHCKYKTAVSFLLLSLSQFVSPKNVTTTVSCLLLQPRRQVSLLLTK